MVIFSDVSIDILARNKCSLLTYLFTYLIRFYNEADFSELPLLIY